MLRRLRRGAASLPPSLTVRLPDGRSLAVEEYGDPAGPVVFYFHGWPACRLEAGLIPPLAARLLAFDRPGYGGSSPHPGRTLLDWPADVARVADRLGIGRFHVVGLSGGGPYGAACAYALPERVISLALVAPVPPAHAVARKAPGVGHLYSLGRHVGVASRLFSVAQPLLRRRIITPQTLINKSLPPPDRAALTPATLARLSGVWSEGIGHGLQGMLSDAQIYAGDWGFDPAGITVPTSLWYGTEDSLIPREGLAPYESIQGVRVHMLEREGHYSLPLRHAADILAGLLAAPQLSSSLSQ